MKLIWIFATAAALYGAIAGILDQTTYLPVAFGLLGVVFAWAAYREIAGKN